MLASDFHSPESGRIVRTATGYDAFVPATPPPVIRYDPLLVLRLSQADAALGRLAAIGEKLPSPGLTNLLATPYRHREAVLSSRIEGTRAGLSDVLIEEVGESPRNAPSDVRDIHNYLAATSLGAKRIAEGAPFDLSLVKELHAALMSGVPHASPGSFRTSQVWIGAPGSTLGSAIYVPPPPDEMDTCLAEWETFSRQRDELPDLVQCAIMHEHFEAVHPFSDGNGRVGRMLITLYLLDRCRLTQPLLYLSEFIEGHRGDYYDLLMRVRTRGDWIAWLHFFLLGVKVTADAAIERAEMLVDLREEYRFVFHGKRLALQLVDTLFANPYTTVSRVEDELGVSPATARTLVANMEGRGFLKRIPESRWGKLYVAPQILEALGDAA